MIDLERTILLWLWIAIGFTIMISAAIIDNLTIVYISFAIILFVFISIYILDRFTFQTPNIYDSSV